MTYMLASRYVSAAHVCSVFIDKIQLVSSLTFGIALIIPNHFHIDVAGFPTHTWTDEEVAKIKKYAAERKAKSVANDDDIHAGFEMRFPTHTWTNEEVEDIKAFANDVQNDDDIHAGLEMRFPTHTNTEEEIHQMQSEEAKSKTEKVLNNFFNK